MTPPLLEDFGPPQYMGLRMATVDRPRPGLRLLLLGLLLAPGPARAEAIWVEIRTPRSHELVRGPVGLVELRGWAGTGVRGFHDVVLAIDRTASTFDASGVDVDGDGQIGRRVKGFEHLRVISDPDDSIQAAQLLAARRLIEKLDGSTTRMGIVTFARTEKVLARIGTPRDQLLAALDGLPARPGPGGTYFYGAIIASIKVFEQAPPSTGEFRHRSIIFLSDGLPNRPAPPAAAAKAAVRASQHARNARIRIYAFALGTEVAAHPEVFRDMVQANEGELLVVEQPAEIIDFVPHMSLTRLRSIELENRTMGKAGRAVRLFPDGTFDGYVPLVAGDNRLRVTVRAEGGGVRELERTVRFEQTAGDTAVSRARLEALLAEIRLRTLETQLAAEVRVRRQRALARQLEIKVERKSTP